MPGENRVVREGLLVGFVAYASVALFYAVFDFLAARGPLFTVNLLGLAVFKGVRDPSILQLPIPVDATAVFWYNALHLVLSLAIGLVVVRLVAQAEARPSQARAMLFTIVGGFVVTILAVGILTEPMRALLPWWSIVVANVVAVWMAGSYLLRAHPGIWRRLTT
ncbi:MAG TPA: hypothetical protein PLI70_03390 [Gemmatimonadales bacterium]|nr:hypothetical protein [Gemmatimonadales bacterium]HRZ09224.1 hypothetical protein [Gemmatimonadales bacterium]